MSERDGAIERVKEEERESEEVREYESEVAIESGREMEQCGE